MFTSLTFTDVKVISSRNNHTEKRGLFSQIEVSTLNTIDATAKQTMVT